MVRINDSFCVASSVFKMLPLLLRKVCDVLTSVADCSLGNVLSASGAILDC